MKVKKVNIAKIKEAIKVSVQNQKDYKNQRRTVKLVGKRTMSTKDAAYKHMTNREDLRMMYAAYGIARGKSVFQIESHCPTENHPLGEPYNQRRIEKILTMFTELVEVETEELV